MALEKNPNFREEFYAEAPPTDNPALAAQVQRLQGKRLPLVDRVEISIIEENQPRWLALQWQGSRPDPGNPV